MTGSPRGCFSWKCGSPGGDGAEAHQNLGHNNPYLFITPLPSEARTVGVLGALDLHAPFPTGTWVWGLQARPGKSPWPGSPSLLVPANPGSPLS